MQNEFEFQISQLCPILLQVHPTINAFKSCDEAIAAAAKSAQASDVAIILGSSEELSAELKLKIVFAIASETTLGIHEDNKYKSESQKTALR
ncbi:hypothetical protein K1719_030466 [Acacia pycnantha]|nr:hypothetical protein K1719_030394 [Acacia pycnantha]KAI9087596.1 hypothetical protein K1719_030466 [Acacia pycnantha]